MHRDIKLENILIDLNNNVKICDFGIGRILSSKKQMLHDKCGTPMYMAPEIYYYLLKIKVMKDSQLIFGQVEFLYI